MLLHVDALGKLIERVLAENRWTLSALSRRTGIPVSTLSSWKTGARGTGSRGPAPERLRQFADKVPGVTVAEAFEAAGRHVPEALKPEEERELLHLAAALPEGDREAWKAAGRAMLEQRAKS